MDGGRQKVRERKEEKIFCQVAPGVYLYQALLVEMAVTFQLVLLFSSVAPAVTLGHLMAVYWVRPCAGSLLPWLLHDLVLHPRWSCLGDWLIECKEAFLKDLSKQSRGSENHMEA
uniref:Uncharacterized protein n=1 Tax=Sinocyclocheilus rhinocerous TaxID=307959 RepID=A0A673HIG6_9TELE